MKCFTGNASHLLLLAAAFLFALSAPARAYDAGSRDVLWNVVTNCLDPSSANYCANCRSPLAGTSCTVGKTCQDTTEIWAESEAYLAVRDRKMCGCPEDFVHGLVLPRGRVTGVEDPRRPDGIWSFAWAVARSRIGDESATALAVNPAGMRAQDQLHLHIVRLRKGARQRFAVAHVAQVQKLEEVWGAASRTAAAAGLADYGILVASRPEGGFTVLVDRVSPEKSYTIERCR